MPRSPGQGEEASLLVGGLPESVTPVIPLCCAASTSERIWRRFGAEEEEEEVRGEEEEAVPPVRASFCG